MPTVTATPRSNSNGEVVTEFLDTVNTTPTTYTFPNTQEKLKIKNNGYGSFQLTVNGSVVTVLPTESKEFYGSIDSFVISSSGGMQSFEVVGSNYKDDQLSLVGNDNQVTLSTALSKDIDSVTSYQFGSTINAAYDIAPSDTVDLTNPTTQIYIGGAGDLKVDLLAAGTVTFKALPVGFHRIRAKRVYATGSTATNIVGVYYVPGGV